MQVWIVYPNNPTEYLLKNMKTLQNDYTTTVVARIERCFAMSTSIMFNVKPVICYPFIRFRNFFSTFRTFSHSKTHFFAIL